jgi:biofilm PGA synthesis N-glycosyltransferase PgaC
MHTWLIVFWISCLIIFYNYAGYALLVYTFNNLKKPKKDQPGEYTTYFPDVAFIVAAYNEEDCIKQKIINSLEQDYPSEKIEFLFITDGSSDKTPEIILQYPSIRLLHDPERKGKSAALNRAVLETGREILIISDANTLLNRDATRNITRHYKDKSTGGVAGEKKVIPAPAHGNAGSGPDEVGSGEGLYWKYESFLKKLDSAYYSVVGAAGELFSLRRTLFEALPENVILDDFVLSLRTAQKGYRIHYEPDAYAMELPSLSLRDEQKRKIRIAAGGFQAIGLLLPLLAFWKYPRLSFLYISHRVLRWTLSPLCFILAFVSNAILALPAAISAPGEVSGGILIKVFFAVQLCFYGTAALAWLAPTFKNRFKATRLIYYFVFMNLSVILGFFRFIRGKQSATWEKARRAQAPVPE